MKNENNIISIRNRDIDEADRAFAEFMQKAEDCFNEKSRNNPMLYKKCSASELEQVTHQILVEICPSTPFYQSDIKLIAGHTFPDIMTGDFYGVEVKSTNKDKWTSTGSSIVESTRIKDVEKIYMMFGSLGSNPPAFKCKPYQECLCNIAVTHSPRYLIDMMLDEEDNIFSKMHTDYDTFRSLEESDKISRVRQYYMQKAKREKKLEMPWWMGEAEITNVNLAFYNDMETNTKTDLNSRMYILFPSIFSKNSSLRYKEIALWLCNRYSLLCYNMRDMFSAGGQMTMLNGKKLTKPYPQVVKRLLEYRENIEILLRNPDIDILKDIREYWDFNYNEHNLYESWIVCIENAFRINPDLSKIPIRYLIENKIKPISNVI